MNDKTKLKIIAGFVIVLIIVYIIAAIFGK